MAHQHSDARFPISISLTLATSIGLLVAVSVGFVFWIQWTTAKRTTSELVVQQVNLIADKILQDLESQLAPAVHQLDFVAEKLESGEFDFSDDERLATLLISSMAAAPQIFAVSFIDRSYQSIGARRGPDGRVRLQRADNSQDEKLAAEIRESLDADRAHWGNIVYVDGFTLVNRRRPIRRAGTTVGIVANAVSVTRVSELIEKFGASVGGTGFILYGKDKVLAHPTLTTPHAAQSASQPLISLDQIDDPILGELSKLMGAPNDNAQSFSGGFERRSVDVDGKTFVSFVRWIDSYGDTPWGIGAWLSNRDVDVAKRRLLMAGYLGLAAFLLSLVAAVAVGKSIARPIQRITASVTQIGDFDLSDIQDLPPSRIRELNDQASAFNTMLAGLRSFETYVPRSLVTRLIKEGSGEEIRSQKKELTVMFTDIVGFTSISEGQPASDIAAMVNQHFGILGRCVEAQGGTIDKYIGDALMAFWGAPEDQDDTELRACRAALAMKVALESDNRVRENAGAIPIRIRVGIHTGPVLVGNIGAPGRVNYTIIGDTVNTAQRIEALGKEMDEGDAVTILISGTTASRLPQDIHVTAAGSFEVKGKAEKVEVFRIASF